MPRRKQNLSRLAGNSDEDQPRISNPYILGEAEVEGGDGGSHEEVDEMDQDDLDFIASDDDSEEPQASDYRAFDQQRELAQSDTRRKGESRPDYLRRIGRPPSPNAPPLPSILVNPQSPAPLTDPIPRKRQRLSEPKATGVVKIVDGPRYQDYLAGQPFAYLNQQRPLDPDAPSTSDFHPQVVERPIAQDAPTPSHFNQDPEIQEINDYECPCDSDTNTEESDAEYRKGKRMNIIGKEFESLTPWHSFFCCLATFKICKDKEIPLTCQRRHKKLAEKLFNEVKHLAGVTSLFSPDTVTKPPLIDIGMHYGLHIILFSSKEKRGQICFKDCHIGKPRLNLIQWKNGTVSLMKDPEVYFKQFSCEFCNQDFTQRTHLERHKQRKNCDFLRWREENQDTPAAEYYENIDPCFRVQNRFIGGKYVPRKGLLQEIQELGFAAPEHHDFQPFLCIWDIETMGPKSEIPNLEDGIQIETVHVPISISVLSSVPGYDTCKTFIGFTPGSELTRQWLQYMNEMSDKAFEIAQQNNEPLLQQLRESYQKCLDRGNERRARRIDKLLNKLLSHMRHLPSIGFNSSRFDLPAMIRSAGMAFWLTQMDGEPPRVIKKTTDSYMVLTSHKLRFLDLCLFLSPGISLRSLVRQSGIKADLSKLFFPYTFLKSRKDLHYTRLPDYEEFFSDLKQANVLDEDHQVYQSLLSKGMSQNDAIKAMNLDEVPPTGEERHAKLKEMWTDMGFKYLWEYLALYNSFDCLPLLQVCEKIREQFWELIQYDCFEFTTISSLAFPYLMQNVTKYANKNANFFAMIRPEAFEMVERSVCGGSAHSFNKIAISGLTEIEPHRFPPEERERIEAIKVYDLNSLYASTIGKNLSQTLGFYAIRRKSENFRMLEVMEKNKKALVWLDYVNEVELGRDHYVRTALTIGGEKLLHLGGGKSHHVDGWCEDEGLALEFAGCFWHGCPDCFPNREEINPRNGRTYGDLYEETKETEELIKANPMVKELVTIWECEWDRRV